MSEEIDKVISPRCVEIFMSFYPDSNAMKLEVRMKEPTVENIVNFLKASVEYIESGKTENFKNFGTSTNRRFMPSVEYMAEISDKDLEIASLRQALKSCAEALKIIYAKTCTIGADLGYPDVSELAKQAISEAEKVMG